MVVDWAEGADGTRVPASVTLTSLGGTLADAPAPDREPRAVTRALVESVQWGSVLWESGDTVRSALPNTGLRARQYATTDREQLLRLVADLYRALGGERNPRVAEDVRRELDLRGVRPARRGKPSPDGSVLTPTRVRAWIKQARQRGFLEPSRRRASPSGREDPRRSKRKDVRDK